MIELAELPLWVYAAVGSAILWTKMKNNQRGVYGLTEMIEMFVPETWPRARGMLEILIYLFIGCLISVQRG